MGLLFYFTNVNGQSQRIADSLIVIYNEKDLNEKDKLNILESLAFNERVSIENRLKYADWLIELSIELDNYLYLHRGYLQKGHALRLKGDLDEAIQSLFKAAKAAKAIHYQKGLGTAYASLGNIYSVSANHNNSVLYYNKAITILKKTNDSITWATALLNAGDEYLNVDKLDSALIYFQESTVIFNATQYQAGIAYSYGNIGLVYAKQGKHTMAEDYINKATALLEKTGDRYPIAVYDTYMADIYLEKGDWQRAIKYAHHSLQIAQEGGLKAQIRDASKKLAELYELLPNYKNAYTYQKQYLAYRDSLNNEDVIQNMADLRTEYEVSQKQVEVDLLSEQRRNQQVVLWALGFILMLVGGLVFVLFRNARQKNRSNRLLSEKNTQIESQRDELQTTNIKLVELDQFKQGMTSMIVHDLKNPLSGIINRSGDEKVQQSGKQMLHMVLNILDVDKYENTSMTLDRADRALLEITNNARSEVLFLAKQKNIKLNNNISASSGVFADSEITERVFTNILSNAIKHSPINGKVDVFCEDVTEPDNKLAAKYLKISIADSGQGIPADKQHLIFQKFGQVMAKKSGGVRSTGLGLAFCKLAVEAHGGQIGVVSDVDKGSVFWFTLPKGQSIIESMQSESEISYEPLDARMALSESEQLYLLPYILKLKEWEVFDVSELESIIEKLNTNQSEAIAQWKKQLEHAIYLCNDQLFQSQLDRAIGH